MTSQMTLDDICQGVTKQVRLARPMVSPPTSRTCGLIRVVRGLEGAFVVWETVYASDLQPLLTDDPIGGGNPTEASPLKAGIRRKPVHLRWCRSAFQPRFGKPSCQVISSYHYLTNHSADLPRFCHTIKTHAIWGSAFLVRCPTAPLSMPARTGGYDVIALRRERRRRR